MAITIKDLAQMANTSTATVSRVLSNKPGVAEEKRRRIIELADRLGYSPNRIAQNLALQKSHVLGLIAADLRNLMYVEFLHRIQSQVEELGYQVLLADSELDVEKERHNIQMMRQHRAEGLIIFPVRDYRLKTDVDHLLELKLQKFPFVVVGKIDGYGFDYISSEEVETSKELTQVLIDQGHRKIAFVGLDEQNRPIVGRFEGYKKALQEAGIPLEDRYIVPLGEEEHWRETLRQLLESSDRPTGLVIINDICALMAYRPIADAGLKIPDDVSIVAFGDDVWAKHMMPSLTTTSTDSSRIANIALDLLLKRIDDPTLDPYVELIPQTIHLRESVTVPSDVQLT